MNPTLKQAIDNNELFFYLTGQKSYAVPCPFANMPTDTHAILDSIEPTFVKDEFFQRLLINTLIQLSQSPEYSWLSTYYVVGFLRIERRWGSIFLDDKIISKIREGLYTNMLYLKNSKKWIGNDWENGLWGDVLRMSNNIIEKYKVSLVEK
jgi:hypothetical protein